VKRLLVTASRAWHAEPQVMRDALSEAVTRLLRMQAIEHVPIAESGVTLVHGDAWGGDQLAAEAFRSLYPWLPRAFLVEAHPADWNGPCDPASPQCVPGHRVRRPDGSHYCPTAGTRRNVAMIKLGADAGLAFILDHSAGASHCLRAMRSAGIDTTPVYDWDRLPRPTQQGALW